MQNGSLLLFLRKNGGKKWHNSGAYELVILDEITYSINFG